MFNIVKGKEVARIVGGGPLNDVKVRVETDPTAKRTNSGVTKAFNYMKLNKDMKFQPTPNTTHERDVYYVCGPSGSGKSYFTKQYIENYHKEFPQRPVYMFSTVLDDKTLKGLKYVKHAKLTESIVQQPFDVKDFKDSLVIMDDVDTIRIKMLKKQLYN